MSEDGETYTAGQKFYTAAGSDGSDKSHLCFGITKNDILWTAPNHVKKNQ